MKLHVRSIVALTIGFAIMLSMFLSCGGGGGGGVYGNGGGGNTTSTVELVTCPVSGSTDIAIADFSFTPADITVAANATVKWTNNGATTHTVTGTTVPTNGSFNSSMNAGGPPVCYKFTTAGTYHYQCSIHTTMTGTVNVS